MKCCDVSLKMCDVSVTYWGYFVTFLVTFLKNRVTFLHFLSSVAKANTSQKMDVLYTMQFLGLWVPIIECNSVGVGGKSQDINLKK